MTDIRFMLKSRYKAEVRGEEPSRFLNRAAAKGIYVYGVKPFTGGLRFRLSRKAYDLMKDDLPEGLELRVISEYGAPRFFRKYKGRFLLFAGIPLAALMIFAYTRFIWTVDIEGGTPELRGEVSDFLEKEGVRPGAWKSGIDRNKVKREAILAIDDLMWLWVDIRGAGAKVSVASRDMPPEMFTDEPTNVIASETGVVESVTVTGGESLVAEGQTVEKGSVLISGVIDSERVEPMIRHAGGSVIARVWREKTVLIPKVTEKRTRTGNIKKIKAIKIKKFIVNFSLNSSILYPKYDKIRMKYTLGALPVEFISDEYHEVAAEYEDTDLETAKAGILDEFTTEISDSGAQLVSMDAAETDRGEYLEYRLTAQCLTDIAKTVPLG